MVVVAPSRTAVAGLELGGGGGQSGAVGSGTERHVHHGLVRHVLRHSGHVGHVVHVLHRLERKRCQGRSEAGLIGGVDVGAELTPRRKVTAESRVRTALTAAHRQISGRRLTEVSSHCRCVNAERRWATTSVRADGEHVGIVDLKASARHNTRINERPVGGVVGCLADNTRTARTTRAESRTRAPDAAGSRRCHLVSIDVGVGVDRWEDCIS